MTMRPFASTMPLADAMAVIAEAAVPVSRTETLPLDRAGGRVLAGAVTAQRDVPPFDKSAMDGYAVRAADTVAASADGSVTLHIVEKVFTGEVASRAVGDGECITIATGAPLPAGADAVVPVEDTSRGAGTAVHVMRAVTEGQHVVPRGSDMAAGTLVLDDGAQLTAARVGALAALGRPAVNVYAQPTVFVASTGNEVVEPGRSLKDGQIYDVNRFTLPFTIRQHGGVPIVGPAVADTIDGLRETLDTAERAGADLIVLSGGSSVGERDLLVDALRERGQVLFHGIAIKPGKPTLFGRLGRVLFLGLPGNPTSCLSNAFILLVPLLRRMARLPAWRPHIQPARLAGDVRNASGRHTFFTVRLVNGQAVAAFKGSGDITSLALADGFIEIPADVTLLRAGALVSVTMF
jgi:molybdenum cofactor synthesis domain-containing protein